MWENYLIVSGLESKPDKYKCALLLHTIGREALRFYNGFDMTVAQRQTPSEIIKKFDEHIQGGTKEFFERYKFNMCYQKSEPFEQYYSTLRNPEKTFCDCMRDKLIIDRLILGVKSSRI